MPAFVTLWNNHPNITGETPLLDKVVYENQCAINLSASLLSIHVRIGSFGMHSLGFGPDLKQIKGDGFIVRPGKVV